MKFVKCKNGKTYKVDFNSVIDKNYKSKSREGIAEVEILGIDCNYYDCKILSVYYRQERTWNDHMGNTPCGYYVIVPFPNGEKKRVYMF